MTTKQKKILVTGGAGYIGSHTVVELYHSGFQTVIVDNFSNSEKRVLDGIKAIIKQPVTLYEGNCNDETFLKNVFQQEPDITGVIHFAAYKAVGESVQKPLDYYQNNIGSLMTLLKVMSAFHVSNLVFSSSCTVYGQPDQLPVTEQSPKKMAESPYGNTKQICEEILEDFVKSQAQLKVTLLRYFNPIGAHPSAHIGELPIGVPNNLVPFIMQTASGIREKLTVFGDDYNTPDGTCIRDYIHVVDLAKAHVKSLYYLEQREGSSFFDIFNLGTGQGNSVMEVIKAFEQIQKEHLNYTIGPRRSGDVEQVYANVDKAGTLFNWKAELSLEEALIDAWRWQKA
ncbi:MAG: UDP-glucose 4-epimerase GalE [Candidatus Scalindua sp.]|nr:UDP-glucose 4-epimerase GalE [Candidatus Scalindua sp.]